MGSKTSTVTEKADPWAPSQAYLKDVMAQSRGLFNNRSTVADQNPILKQGYQNTLASANFNPALTNDSTGLMADTIRGDYMNNNPYLDATFDRMSDKVTDGVNSNFSMAGRYGSGAHQGVLGETLGNLATDVYGDNYRTERQNQLSAGQFAPQMDSARQGMLFNNANQWMNVGNQMQDYNQFSQMEPYNRLNQYSSIINGFGGLGGSGSTTTPSGGNRLGGALGGAASGFAMGNAIVPGIGGFVGAGLGGIGGLF